MHMQSKFYIHSIRSSAMLLINPEMKIFLLLILALANAVTGQTVQCPGPYHAIGNGCYLFPAKNESSWITAQLFCEFSGGYLAKIDSATEQTDLEVYYNEHAGNGSNIYFIGATDMLNDGIWRWAPSGETLDYENWGPNDPLSSPIYNCAFWYSGGSYWGSLECCTFYEQFSLLCEADPL